MFRHLLIAALAVAVGGPVFAQTSADSVWRQFSAKPGTFSVMIPGPMTPDAPTTDKGTVTHLFTASHNGQKYVVTYSDGEQLDTQRNLNTARDGLLNALPATLVSEHRFQSMQPIGAVTASEITGRNAAEQTICRARVFVTARRIYVIGTATREGAGSAVDMDKFLDSFKNYAVGLSGRD